jgi:glycosyltransferase involved in cell wall biosynthesis
MVDVLHLIDTYRIGGPGKTIINSAKFIDGAYRVHVGAFTRPQPGFDEFSSAVRAAGIPFLDLPERRRIEFGHVGLIRRYVREHGIRIVHPHGYRTDVLAYLATRRLPVIVVTTHHGWIRNNSRQELMARMALQVCRLLDGVEVVSRRLLDDLPGVVVRDGRAEVVHNAIVLGDYAPAGVGADVRHELSLPPDAELLGVVGRLSVEKGCLDMIVAFEILAASRPRLHLAFAGEGPQLAELRARAAQGPAGDRIHFVGYQASVRRFYEAIDVLVSPSHTEGISNAILEGMVVGRPIVATRVGGTPELVEDLSSALLVESKRPPELAAAIARVLAEPPLRRSLVEGARRRVETEFAFPARMRKEEAFYERILTRRGLPGAA